MSGRDRGKRFALPDGVSVIGRDSKRLPLRDETCSRRHAEIGPAGGGDRAGWEIKDLGSSNGTFVNGNRVLGSVPLHLGDQVRLGRTRMVFSAQPGIRPGTTPRFAGPEEGMDSSILGSIRSTPLAPSRRPTDGSGSGEDSMMDSIFGDDAAAGGRAAHKNLTTLYRLSAALGSSFSEARVMEVVMDLVFDSIHADRGIGLLLDPRTGEPVPVVTRTRDTADDEADGENDPVPASRTIVNHVLERDEAVLCNNALGDRRFKNGKSVQHMRIRSALCVPIRTRRLDLKAELDADPGTDPMQATMSDLDAPEQTLGVIYVDASHGKLTFTEDHLRLLTAIGWQAGLALQNAKLYRQNLQAERLAAVGETTAALSHGIKNILQALRGGADNVEMGFERGNLRQAQKGWNIVDRNLGRIYQLTMNLLAWSKPRKPRFEMMSPRALIDECLELVAQSARDRGVMALADVPEDLPAVPLDQSGMHQVLMNLLTNALEAFDDASDREKVVTVGCDYEADLRRLTISVSDTGAGISESMSEHLFELFHSTKGNRGTGLGLPVVKKIVQEHEGTIRVDSKPDEGTTFTIQLPVNSRALGDPGGTLHRAG